MEQGLTGRTQIDIFGWKFEIYLLYLYINCHLHSYFIIRFLSYIAYV